MVVVVVVVVVVAYLLTYLPTYLPTLKTHRPRRCRPLRLLSHALFVLRRKATRLLFRAAIAAFVRIAFLTLGVAMRNVPYADQMRYGWGKFMDDVRVQVY